MHNLKQHHGFTLIELLAVLIVLGILAATALPRFLDLRDNASVANIEGTGAAFKTTIALAHMKWLAGGFSGPVDNFDLYGDSSNLMDMNSAGWPAQSYPPFEANPTLNNTADCISVWGAVLESGGPTVATNISSDYRVTYASNTCTFALVAEPTLSIFYDSNSGVVTTDSTL